MNLLDVNIFICNIEYSFSIERCYNIRQFNVLYKFLNQF